jgi:nanoRNase/pAp phosphatase (c-di-AMP/oligoRNAs hydrolase)
VALNLNQQIFEATKQSNRILVTFQKDPNGDALSSGLGLALILQKLEKKVDVVSDNFSIPKNFSFLPKIEQVQPSIADLKKFVISFDISQNKINDLSYDIRGNKLNIFITPEQIIDKHEIKTGTSGFKYDLIFVVDTPDLESLGNVYYKNTDFFYHTPTINIDHSPANENFGQINLINLTAASTSEIIFQLLESLNINFLDEDIATLLLTGIISKTKSFKMPTVTPHTLSTASRLVAQGARREDIVKNLYQTKSFDTLKLWGRALARLRSDTSCNLVWTVLTREDFITTGASPDKLIEVVDELIFNSRHADIVALIYEAPEEKNKICCFVSSEKNINLLSLTKPLESDGSKNLVNFCLFDKNIIDAEKKVINALKESLKNKSFQPF